MTLVKVFVAGVLLAADVAAGAAPPLVGPASGSLVIVGGSMHHPQIIERFIALAGGRSAPIVVVPTALGGDLGDTLDRFGQLFRAAGVEDVTVVHTRDRQRADTEEFTAPLGRARGVWFGGGRQWRLVDAYAGTRAEQAFHDVLARGGVIGGTSAGATIQGSYLVRGAPEGNAIMMSPGHEKGFGFLRGVAIDQHVIARGRQKDMIPVIRAHPDLLGIGIDEDTALVVHGDEAEVIGSSRVLIYDAARWGREAGGDGAPAWISLRPGERFDLGTRRRVVP